MNKSESISNISKAFCQFQSEVKNPSNDAINPHFKSKYSTLANILNTILPILTKHKLAIIQNPSSDGSNVVINTTLLHESGEWIELDQFTIKPDKVTAQGLGSAITYGRRYTLSALLGISSEDDDDGIIASGSMQNSQLTKNLSAEKVENKLADKNAGLICESCKSVTERNVADYSLSKFKKIYCRKCQQNLSKNGG